MELRNSYFDPDYEQDQEFIHINDHLLKLGDIESDFEQLIDELYDDCEHVDINIVHELIVDICNKLQIKNPDINNLKLQ